MLYYIIPFALVLIGLIVVTLVIYGMALEWIMKLETTNCKCSEDFKRDYIKYYLYIYFANLAFIIISSVMSMIYIWLVGKKSGMVFVGFLQVIYKIIQFFIPFLSMQYPFFCSSTNVSFI